MNELLLKAVEAKITPNAGKILRKRVLSEDDIVTLHQHYKAIENTEIPVLIAQKRRIENKLKIKGDVKREK